MAEPTAPTQPANDLPTLPKPEELAQLQQYAAALDMTLRSEGWQKVIQPGIISMRDLYLSALVAGNVQDPQGRAVSDDQARAIIKTLGWLLDWPARRDAVLKELMDLQALSMQQNPVYEGGSPAAAQPDA